jgi:hypothetical protein
MGQAMAAHAPWVGDEDASRDGGGDGGEEGEVDEHGRHQDRLRLD